MNIDEIEREFKEAYKRYMANPSLPFSDDLKRERTLIEMVRKLEKDKAGLVKSLKFYAKHDNYCDEAEGQDPLIYLDTGQVARDAIKQHGGEQS